MLDFPRKKSRLAKIFTFFIIIYPLTSVYASPIKAVSMGNITILIMIIPMTIDILFRQLRLRIVPFWVYMIYAFFVTLFTTTLFTFLNPSYSISGTINRVIRDAFFLITIVVFGSFYFSFVYGKKILKNFMVILCYLIIIQSLVYKISGVYIPGIIPQLKTTISGGFMGYEYNSIFQQQATVYGVIRCSGFLAEPAVVGQVLPVALLLELFNRENIPNKVLCSLYSITLVLTFSANSYVALILCWTLWALYTSRYNRKNIIKIVVALFVLISSLIFLLYNEKTASVFYKIFDLKERTSGSAVVRVLRGIFFYFNIPIQYKIFGIGFGNFLEFKRMYGITTIYENVDEYMNMNAYILISAGLVGFLLFIVTILQSIKTNQKVSHMIFILLLVLGMSSSLYSTPQFTIMMMFILFSPKENFLDEDSYNYSS